MITNITKFMMLLIWQTPVANMHTKHLQEKFMKEVT